MSAASFNSQAAIQHPRHRQHCACGCNYVPNSGRLQPVKSGKAKWYRCNYVPNSGRLQLIIYQHVHLICCIYVQNSGRLQPNLGVTVDLAVVTTSQTQAAYNCKRVVLPQVVSDKRLYATRLYTSPYFFCC